MFWLNLRFSGTILEHSFHKLFFIQLIFNFCHCWRLHIKIFVIITKPSTMAMFKLRWVKEVLLFLLPHMFHAEVGLSAICMCLQYILRKSVKHLWYFQYVLRKSLQEEKKWLMQYKFIKIATLSEANFHLYLQKFLQWTLTFLLTNLQHRKGRLGIIITVYWHPTCLVLK